MFRYIYPVLVIFSGSLANEPSTIEKDFSDTVASNNFSPHGIVSRTHKITTDDGYILTAFALDAKPDGHGKPIILQHGLLDSAYGWILGTNSIARYLYEEGYQVWLPNTRGTAFSQEHESLNTTTTAYWNFTMVDFALYDIPAVLQYISKTTGVEKIPMVGHSQGGASVFIGASSWTNADDMVPKFNSTRRQFVLETLKKHIKIFVGVSPVHFVNHIQTVFMKEGAKHKILEMYFEFREKRNLFHGMSTVISSMQGLCRSEMGASMCPGLYKSTVGHSPLDDTDLNIQWSTHFPSGTSTLNALMWSQWARTGQMDLEVDLTGSRALPFVDIATLAVPTALFYGSADYLVSTADQERASALLRTNPNVKAIKTLENFTHATWQNGNAEAQRVFQSALTEVLSGTKIPQTRTTTQSSLAMHAICISALVMLLS